MLTYRLTRAITAEILRNSGPTTANRQTDWATYRRLCFSPRTLRLQQPSIRGQQLHCLATAAPQATHNMEDTLTKYIQHIHDAPMQGVFHATGGGMQALTWLLTVPGASRTVLESRVPYAQSAMEALLQQATVSYASAEAAQQLAKAAYNQAAQLSQLGTPIVGVGCTCALMTDRIKKGDHKAFVATHTGSMTRSYSLQLTKGKRSRLEEDAVASKLLLKALASACTVPEAASLDLGLLPDSEHVQEGSEELQDPLEALLQGKVKTVEYSNGQIIVDAPRRGRVYMAGSFNPLHKGHRGMLAAALQTQQERKPGKWEGCYELSVGNADKGLLPIEEIRRRIEPFLTENLPLVLTQAPLYPDKAILFPDSAFVLGYDTAIRLLMPKYYGGNDEMLLQLASMSYKGCSILAVGRVADEEDGSSSFKSFEDVDVPEALDKLGLFVSIPEDIFRSDISSTQLRKELEASKE